MIYLCFPGFLYFLRLYGVNGTEKIPVGIYAKKTLTKREEAIQKRDRVGNDVVQLGSGESKKIQQERMGRKRKASIDVRKEKHLLIGPRARLDLTWARETTPITRDQSLVLVTTDVLRRHDGR